MIPLALLQAAPAAAQGITALWQNRQANKMAEGLVDPNYQIPEEYQRSLGNAQTLAQQKYMAGYGQMQDNLAAENAATTADITQGATSGAEALAAYTNVNRNSQRTQRDIGIANAQSNEQRQAALRQQLMMYGQQKEKQFEINTMQPFLRDAAAASALKNSALRNGMGAINKLAGAGAQYFGNKLLAQNPTQAPQYGMPQMGQTSASPMIAPNTYTGQPLTPEQLMMLQQTIQQGGTTSYSDFQP